LRPRLIVTGSLWLLCSFQGPPRGRWAGRSTRWSTGEHRSLKTQQHARPRARRYAARRESAAAARNSETAAGPARFGRRSSRAIGDRRSRRCPKAAASRRRRAARVPYLGLPRKEVIQPHLPVRLPCYDFTPVTSPTFDGSLPCGLGHRLRVLLTPVV
jgi:hypothetical protein